MFPFLIEHLGELFFHQQYWAPDLVDVEFAGKLEWRRKCFHCGAFCQGTKNTKNEDNEDFVISWRAFVPLCSFSWESLLLLFNL